MLSFSYPLRLASTLSLLATLAACGGDEDPMVNPTPDSGVAASDPMITTFTVSETRVRAGAQVTFTYAAVNATTVKIDASTGEPPLTPTTDLEGQVRSQPITALTTFTFTASGNGKMISQEVVVDVAGPDALRIDSFTANPTTIQLGQSSTLNWMTANADSVEVTSSAGEVVVPVGARLSGNETVTPTVSVTYTLIARASGDEAQSTVTIDVERPVPTIASFVADPAAIDLGDLTTLRWEVMGATSIRITNQGGTEVFRGNQGMGEQVVGPTLDEVYTLEARNNFGPTTMTAVVTVRRPDGAMVNSFAALPTRVDFGTSTTLSWDVSNALAGVEIRAFGRTATTSRDATGQFTTTPTVTTNYQLLARSPNGDAQAFAMVQVNPTPPRVDSFTANPNPSVLGDTTLLEWSTIGASTVRLLRTAPTMEVLDGAAMPDGSALVRLDDPMTTYQLMVTNPHGMASEMVTVTAAAPPSITTFSVEPATFRGLTTTATATWATVNATSVALTRDGVPVSGFPGTAGGTFSFQIASGAQFELIAGGTAGEVRATALVSQLGVEAEPNNDSSVANDLGAGGGVDGQLSDAADRDFFVVDVPLGGSIFAATSDGNGGCGVNTLLRLIARDAQTELGSDDNDGPGADQNARCSEIDPQRDVFARDLEAGRYYISVEGVGGAVGAYALVINVTAPRCGNNLVEARGGEQCDDGNTIDSDNCTAQCLRPIAGRLAGPTNAQIFPGELNPAGAQRFYEVTMASEGYIRAESWVPSAPQCAGSQTNTILRLYDRRGVVLGSDDDGGVGRCAKIDPSVHAFAFVPAGVYILALEDFENNNSIAQYSLRIEALGLGCGNGVIESAAPFLETCDDGNTADNDGCGSTCQFEGAQEIEPNDDPLSAFTITSTPAEISGALLPAADTDYYAINVPSGYHLRTWVSEGNGNVCTNTATTGIQLLDTDGFTSLVSDTRDGFSGSCGRISPEMDSEVVAMAGGTYYLRVFEESEMLEIPSYFLNVEVIAPGCGNTVLDQLLSEECDDGNQVNGDGCDAQCLLEIQQTITAPGGTHIVNLQSMGAFALFEVILDTPGQSIRARAEDPMGGCTVDTGLVLSDQFFTPITRDSDGGTGDCAAFVIPGNLDASDLNAGTYHIAVVNEGPVVGQSRLTVEIVNPACGNGVLEALVGETCDDGNAAGGDGCSASCSVEPLAAYMAPGATSSVGGALTTADQQDVYQIDVSAPTYLNAVVYTPGDCPGPADTYMRLFASDGLTQLGDDQIDGPGLCSAIRPSDGFARLMPGRYFLTVEEFGRDRVLGSYTLLIEGIAADVCGNGVLEMGEACDDGNLVTGDGCNGTCQFEGNIISETEPNDTQATANGFMFDMSSDATLAGRVDPRLDADWWSFTVPAGAALQLTAETYGVQGDTTSCGIDTVLTLVNAGSTQLARNDDKSGTNRCSRVTRQLTPGTYWLRVEPFSQFSGTFSYFLDVQLR